MVVQASAPDPGRDAIQVALGLGEIIGSARTDGEPATLRGDGPDNAAAGTPGLAADASDFIFEIEFHVRLD